MMFAGAYTTSPGLTVTKGWSQLLVFHMKEFITPEKAKQGEVLFQQDLWLNFSRKIVSRGSRRTVYECVYCI